MSRYTVWSVGRDGGEAEHLSCDSPERAVILWRELAFIYGKRIKVGITDNENPEAGDVSDRLAEEV